jgi:paraquat-inducible protein B
MSDKEPPPQPEPSEPEAEAVHRRRISVAWVAPIIAAVLAVVLIVDTLRSKGPQITIRFEDATGISDSPGHDVQVRFKGVPVGKVDSFSLTDDLRHVAVKVTLNADAEAFARRGARFWIERPQITLSGVRGLGTILSGSFIHGEPGQGKEEYTFDGLSSPPVGGGRTAGLRIVLVDQRLSSLDAGAPIHYRGVEVGEVEGVELAGDARSVRIHVRIEPGYAPLVRRNSVFWNASGIAVKLTLLGIRIDAESLKSLLVPTVSFATPDTPAAAAGDGAAFTLHDKPKDEWKEWSPSIAINPSATNTSIS